MSGMAKPSYLVQLYCDSYGHINLMIQTERGPKLDTKFIDPRVTLGQDEVELDIPKEGIVLNGWSITPVGTTKIRIPVHHTRGMVSRAGPTGETRRGGVPCCALRVQWTSPTEPPVKLFYKIKLLGAKPPADFIPLQIEPPYSPSKERMPKRKNPTTEEETPPDKKRKKERSIAKKHKKKD